MRILSRLDCVIQHMIGEEIDRSSRSGTVVGPGLVERLAVLLSLAISGMCIAALIVLLAE